MKVINKTPTPRLCAVFVIVASFVALPSPGSTQVNKEHRAKVEMLLKAYDGFPDIGQFKAAADDPRAVLLEIESDPSASEIVRLQALDGLSLFPNDVVRSRFRTIVTASKGSNPAPRATHNAINGLIHGWGQAAVPEVLALLEHPDVQVRLTVVVAVGRSGGASGHAALRAHLGREKDPVVREFIETHAPLKK